MNKLFKAAAAFVLSAALLTQAGNILGTGYAFATSATSATDTAEAAGTANDVNAATEEAPSTNEPVAPTENAPKSNPVVVDYYLTNKTGREIKTLTVNMEFNLRITIKDIGLKANQITGAEDIDFIKTLDSFKGTVKNIGVTTKDNAVLEYTVDLQNCSWTGSSNTFNFMVGYLSLGSNYASSSITITECVSSSGDDPGSSDTPDVSPEPIFKVTATEPAHAIKAGEEGAFRLSIKNLGAVEAKKVLVEVAPSEDILITEGTGSQDINYIDGGDTESLEIKYKALAKINSEKQNFQVSINYYYENGVSEMTGSTTAVISLMSEVSTVEKVYPVVLTDFDLAETELAADKEYSGSITISNIGTADMKGVFVELSSADGFILTGDTSSQYIPLIGIGKSEKIPVKIKTLSALESLKQPLSMSYKYTYVMGSDEIDGSGEKTFTMFAHKEPAPETPEAPVPLITMKKIDEAVSAGHKYRCYIYIENKGGTTMEDIRVNIKNGDGLTVVDGTDTAFIDKISAGRKRFITVFFETAAELTAAKLQLDVDMTYSYQGAEKKEQGTGSASLSIDSEISGAPVLRLTGENLGYAIVSNNEYDYKLTLKNFADISVRDIYVNLTASDSLYFVDGTEYAHIDLIRPGMTAEIPVRFKTIEKISSIKQGITAAINYSYGVLNAQKQGVLESAITIIAAVPEEEDDPENPDKPNKAAPNVIIGSYDIGLDQIPAGETFELALELFNTSTSTPVENLVMTVNASGDIGIYGGGNTFFYQDLAAAGNISETVKLRALPTAATATSPISISFKYDYMNGDNRETVTSTQELYVPVFQPDKMSFEVNVPTYSVMAGNEVYITTTYLNKGKSDIANVKAEIVGDVQALSTSKVIGNVVPGGNGSFDFIITPMMGGECSFTIKMTYEDAMMTEVVKELPVTFTVEEMMWEDPGMYEPMTFETQMEEGGEFPWWLLWIGIGVVVVGGVVAIILIVKHKKKKNKKLTEADINWEDDLDDVLSDNKPSTKV